MSSVQIRLYQLAASILLILTYIEDTAVIHGKWAYSPLLPRDKHLPVPVIRINGRYSFISAIDFIAKYTVRYAEKKRSFPR